MAATMMKSIMKMMPRERAKSLPTDDNFLQNGHRANWLLKVLNRNVSSQWPHLIRHIPGVAALLGRGAVLDRGLGSLCGPAPESTKLMILLQLPRGQAIRRADDLHTRRQLQGHRIYFLPVGASFIGYKHLEASGRC